jgi:hypothetical protein
MVIEPSVGRTVFPHLIPWDGVAAIAEIESPPQGSCHDGHYFRIRFGQPVSAGWWQGQEALLSRLSHQDRQFSHDIDGGAS